MSDTVIRVENLSKKYIIGRQKREGYTALRDVMADGAKSLGRQVLKPFAKRMPDPAAEEFWALKDVSFEIKQGDRMGIIGRNGAGKSTLLKILSRITEPTTGRVSIKGRVASLLEVGTGFHPELTGRENIYLNGAILGMSKEEIKKKFDEIVAFAEVEKFLETPVKRYSSGMYVRLAFAVAAHLQTDILLVDEVLAVGDAEFQKKCLGKMHDVSQMGKTIVFVSHQLGLLKDICNSGILLAFGRVNIFGSIEVAINSYLENQGRFQTLNNFNSTYKYINCVTCDAKSLGKNHVFFGEPLSITTKLDNLPVRSLGLNLSIKNQLGRLVCLVSTNPHDGVVLPKKEKLHIEFVMNFCCLAPGEYFVDVALTEPGIQIIEEAHNIIRFEVYSKRLGGSWAYESRFGDVFPQHEWEIR